MEFRYATRQHTIACDGGIHPGLDEALAQAPAGPGVFAVWPRTGDPWVGRAGNLRRRLARVMKVREQPGRLLYLRGIADRIEYWPTASRLEGWLALYDCSRAYLPDTYSDILKLRPPVMLRLLEANPFPRTQVSARLAGAGLAYGPFRSRGAADEFEHGLLDLFQIRRCMEDLDPTPDHAGCIYGEMAMCLRPCQQVVTPEEYGSESARVAEFLRTEGKSARQPALSARDKLSEEMEFEAAARQHERVERIDALLKLKDDLARDASRLCGVAVQPSVEPGSATLWFLFNGVWQPPVEFSTSVEQGSLDKRLREAVQSVVPLPPPPPREREEHLSILGRWYWSSWRDGVWISAENMEKLSYRRLVSAVSKVVHQAGAAASE